VRWGAGKATGKDCTLLTEATGQLELSAPKCPTWVMPNEAGLGYYRMAPDKPMLDALLKASAKALTLPERVGLIGDVNALVAAGTVDNGVALALVETLAKDKNRHLVDASIGLIAGLDEMVPDKLRPNYERLIKKRFRARAVELGWKSKKGEDDNAKQLRPSLLALVAGNGKDKGLIEEATELVWKWVDDHAAIEPELVGVALSVAARYGDQKLYDRLYADAKKSTDRVERERLLAAMGAFVDPAIVKQAMALILTDEFDLREASGLMQGAFAEPRTRATALAFVKEHFDEITNKLPAPYRAYMAYTVVAVCDDDQKAELKAFFKPRVDKFEGGPRVMEQALEAMSICSAQRKAQTPGVVAFLKRQ
jgi:aminopeptidase N